MMDRSTALSKLAAMTSGLKPAGTSTLEDLTAARTALAGSLLAHPIDPAAKLAGVTASAAVAPSPEDLSALSQILETVMDAAAGTPVPLVFQRILPAPAIANPASTPAQVSGMLPHAIGPFADALGVLHWFDIYPPAQQIAISRTPSTVPFLLLPIALPTGPVPTTLPIAAGTLWADAQLFASAAPAGGYAGVAISGGTLTFSTAATSTAGGLEVDAATTLTLTFTPGGHAGPTGGGTPGEDGGAVVAAMPEQVTFVFATAGATVTAAGDASLTAYGTTIDLVFNPVKPVFDKLLGQLLFAYKPTPQHFTPVSVLSTLVNITGTAKIASGAWALPVAVTAPAQLGTAASPGFLALVLESGLKLDWIGSTGGPTLLKLAILEASAGILSLSARTLSPRRFAMQIDLWAATPPSRAHSSIDTSFPPGALLYYQSVQSFAGITQVETLSCGASLESHLDRPLAADGSRLGSTFAGAVTLYLTSASKGVLLTGKALGDVTQQPPIALALRNALLVTTRPATLLVAGTFSSTPTQLDAGGLLLTFEIGRLLPTLPDPYASNFRLQTIGTSPTVARDEHVEPSTSVLRAVIVWDHLATRLWFTASALSLNDLQLQASPATADRQPFGKTGEHDLTRQTALETLFNDHLQSGSSEFFLLDVSSHVDQLGVGIAPARREVKSLHVAGAEGLTIAGLDLLASTQNLRVMTMPAVQWEPVVTVQNDKVLPYPFPSPAGFLDDGGPTLWAVNDVKLVPVAPAPLFQQVLDSYDGGKAAGALFTLPFGMTAAVTLPERPEVPPPLFQRAALTRLQPSFTPQNMTGGLQMSLIAPASLPGSTDSPGLPGATVQKRNLVDKSGNPVGTTPLSILGPAVDEIFNSQLNPGASGALVPLERIDFSGYGASSFSDWTVPEATPPDVVQVSFKMMVGRTSHEVVQVKSVLYPWGAIVVRTITIERQDNSEVSRYDSGWIAATPGLFRIAGITIHPGAVLGAYNIRGISDTTQTYKDAAGLEMVGVFFDADIQIDGVRSGDANGLVPSTRQFGFVQTAPAGTPVTPAQLAALIRSQGSLGGPVNCVVAVAGTSQTMRLTRVEVDNAPHSGASETNEFAATARGSVVLPQPGSWSVLQRTDSVSEPTPIDPDLGVPLIRQGPAGSAPITTAWRFAEPVDLWVPDSPSQDYCFLHSTDSTRMLFPRPRIAHGATAITSDQVPLLADGFALMNATSVCPRQDDCLTFPDANYALQIGGSGDFTLTNVPASFAPSKPSRALATGSGGAIGFEYADENGTAAKISATISPTDWSVGLQGVNIRVDLGPFDGLMRTVGNVDASSAGGVSFNSGRLVLGSVLEPLQELLSFMTKLGLPNPLALAFSNSGWDSMATYKLQAGLQFTMPSYLLPELWIFMKQPTDFPPGIVPYNASLSLKLGVGNAVSGPAAMAGALLSNSSQWASYLTIAGTFQWEVWPGLPFKVGFMLGFSVQITFAAGKTPGNTALTFQLGGIISVSGQLGPLLSASASVSVVFSVTVVFNGSTKVTLGLMLIISVSAKILDGLVGITFTAEAGGAFTLTSPQSFQATFEVSIDVQLCWVLSIDFQASIQFSHQLSL